MPAGRPDTTGESAIVRFRARGDLTDRLENRRPYPDLRNEPFYGGPRPKEGEHPKIGTVAARDLATFYDVLDAELADAADELNLDQTLMILEAVQGLAMDTAAIANAPTVLADEILDAHADDETHPEPERVQLAAIVAAWPRMRALAALEAALTVLKNPPADHNLGRALIEVGLVRKEQP